MVKNNKLSDGFFQHVMMHLIIYVKCAWRNIQGRKWTAVKYLGRAQIDTRHSRPRILTEEIAAMMLVPPSIGQVSHVLS